MKLRKREQIFEVYMNCPICNNKIKVIEVNRSESTTYRRYMCNICCEEFCTKEKIVDWREISLEVCNIRHKRYLKKKEKKENGRW